MPEYRSFDDCNHFTCLFFVCCASTGWYKNFLVRRSHRILIDKGFEGEVKLKQSGESKVMCCPSCEDSADHSKRSLAIFYLDIFQLGKNVCFASQPGYKLTCCFTVFNIRCFGRKVVPNNKINLPYGFFNQILSRKGLGSTDLVGITIRTYKMRKTRKQHLSCLF